MNVLLLTSKLNLMNNKQLITTITTKFLIQYYQFLERP